MTPFTLNRFESDHGTFRVAGLFSATSLQVSSLALLSTDGWAELDLDQTGVKALVDALEADLLIALNATPD